MTTDWEAAKNGNVLPQGSGGQKSWSLFGASERTPAPTSECSLLVRASSSPCFQTSYCRLGTCSLLLVKSGAPVPVGMAETGLPSVVQGRHSASQVSPGGGGGSLTEQYNAPDNITVRCNESHCLIRWEQPRTRQPRSNMEFQYQLDIQRWVSGLGSEQGSEPQ